MKISYLLPTTKPPQCAQSIIDIIKRLPSHDYEIILVSPDTSWAQNSDVKFVIKEKTEGCFPAINLGYKYCSGDIIALLTDDHAPKSNYLDFLNSATSEETSKSKIRVGNACVVMAAYGLPIFDKPSQSINHIFAANLNPVTDVIPANIPCKPYSLVGNPIIFKEDIDKYMDGVLFNESFHHSYADHWLGIFADYHNKKAVDWPKDVWVEAQPSNSSYSRLSTYQGQDLKTLHKLVDAFNKNPNLSYNAKV